MPPDPHGQRGQASVELVALLPIAAMLFVLAWQGVVAGQTVWLAGTAARAAARAHALGADPTAGVRAAVPARFRADLRVRGKADGLVAVRLAIPIVVAGGRSLGDVAREARFAPQDAP